VPSQTKPVEDREPLCVVSLRRFVHAHQTVSGVPVTEGLRNFTSVEFAGESGPALGLLRAMIAHLVTFHSPDELRKSRMDRHLGPGPRGAHHPGFARTARPDLRWNSPRATETSLSTIHRTILGCVG